MKTLTELLTLDHHHILDSIDVQPDHLRLNFADEMDQDITPEWGVGLTNIVLAGMGGSALGADILRTWLGGRLNVPFEIVRGYSLPGYVDQRSLVIISSYSGNTEETLAALDDASKRAARIVIMTAGGKLLEIAEAKDYMLLKLPQVTQPRLGVLASLKALACLVEDAGLVSATDLRRELLDVANFLDLGKSKFNLDNQSKENMALTIANGLVGKPVIIYAGASLRSAAYKWKIDINENGKQLAWCNVWPELNHNELQGWQFPEVKKMAMVALTSSFEHDRVKKRIAVTEEVLAEYDYVPVVVEAEGATPLAQLLWTVLLGDYVSAYLGLLNGIDPTPVDLVESFKKKLG